MLNDIAAVCHKCWRIAWLRHADDNAACTSCRDNIFFRSSSWNAMQGEVIAKLEPMLWSVFSHCELVTRHVLPGDGNRLAYDLAVPEYRLLIDFHSVENETPTSAGNVIDLDCLDERISINDQKDEAARAANWRYLVLPRNAGAARNKLVQVINEVYVLDGKERHILNPKLQGDAGWDLVCDEDVVCPPGVGTDIPSQVFLEIPNHLYAVVQARSSTSKKRLLVLPGVIDPAYRGQIFTMTFNPTSEPITVKKGDRISQLLFFHRVPHLHVNPVAELRPSERGSKGFGSTGT